MTRIIFISLLLFTGFAGTLIVQRQEQALACRYNRSIQVHPANYCHSLPWQRNQRAWD
jgi:hypothetical protein